MMLRDTHHIVTAANIDDVREAMAASDQTRELEVGCETWGITYQPGNQRGQMMVYPGDNPRGAICLGGDSMWGDWDPKTRVLTVEGYWDEETGDPLRYDEDGDEL